ncbi:TsoY family (seleno)protein [Vannielia sp. SX4]|uniref:TsoY family (seleno)protein n=1 Tax=Vannielia sp. SX4 TaxID=3463852 RepID=UPI004058B042
MQPQSRTGYVPLYFLAALGAGGLMVTFFLYLMFWVPHPGQTVPVFEDILAAFLAGTPLTRAMIVTAWAGIATFAFLMFRSLVWNLRTLAAFRATPGFDALMGSNAGSQLMAVPLALAMAVNGGFILGLVFVPGLWNAVEYLFPLAMVTFLAIGGCGLRLYGRFLAARIGKGGIDCASNNSFSQTLPAFAFAMVGVGLAAPAAMSAVKETVAVSLMLSSFFILLALVIALVTMIMGLRAMMEHGANPEAAPTLLIAIPLLTVVAIAWLRQSHGLHAQLDMHGGPAASFTLLLPLLALQLITGLFGLTVLRTQGYFARFISGPERSPASYALVCPGVALSVMLQFFVNKGLVGAGVIEKFSAVYWAATTPALLVQVATIALVLKLNAKHFGGGRTPIALAV